MRGGRIDRGRGTRRAEQFADHNAGEGGGPARLFVRRPGEDAAGFHARLVGGEADEPRALPLRADGPPALAFLFHGDLALSVGSAAYALFRERTTPTLAASNLLS